MMQGPCPCSQHTRTQRACTSAEQHWWRARLFPICRSPSVYRAILLVFSAAEISLSLNWFATVFSSFCTPLATNTPMCVDETQLFFPEQLLDNSLLLQQLISDYTLIYHVVSGRYRAEPAKKPSCLHARSSGHIDNSSHAASWRTRMNRFVIFFFPQSYNSLVLENNIWI